MQRFLEKHLSKSEKMKNIEEILKSQQGAIAKYVVGNVVHANSTTQMKVCMMMSRTIMN